MQQKLIVISADGLVKEDVDQLMKMPNYIHYFSRASRVEKMRSIYPTITYPCHTTMCTGVYPNKHKVYGNLVFKPGEKGLPWKWFRHYNQWEEDIFFAAKGKGLTTAAIFWPVTGNHPAIDYLIAEYWPQSPQQSPQEAFAQSGSREAVLNIASRHLPGVTIRTHPGTDDFMIKCACDFIRSFQPDLLMIHPGNVDGYRHNYGVFNDVVHQGVVETDRYLGEVMATLEEVGLLEQTNVVLTSDHGLIDVKRIVHLNILFEREGLLQTDEQGKLAHWDAYCFSGGTSALVYIHPDAPSGTLEKTRRLLDRLVKEGVYGISEVFTQEEANRLEHLGGDFAFVLETDGYTAFGDNLAGPLVTNYDLGDYRYSKASHGHLPNKGPQPVFLATGPAFREGVVLPQGKIVDGAPTYAKILGVPLKQADGSPMDELLK